eukprot:COSAG06_NODE_3057_length_5911_cov_29.979869_3_plen_62_part_00
MDALGSRAHEARQASDAFAAAGLGRPRVAGLRWWWRAQWARLRRWRVKAAVVVDSVGPRTH